MERAWTQQRNTASTPRPGATRALQTQDHVERHAPKPRAELDGAQPLQRSRCPAMMPTRDPSRLVLTSDRPGDGVAVVGIGSKTLNLLSSVPIEVADKLHLMLLGIMWEA